MYLDYAFWVKQDENRERDSLEIPFNVIYWVVGAKTGNARCKSCSSLCDRRDCVGLRDTGACALDTAPDVIDNGSDKGTGPMWSGLPA